MGKLYVVGTPIGNLGDFSPRARETLESVDFIAAEDTRVTVKLLNHFEIKKPMLSYQKYNQRERGEEILTRLLAGENAAIVTDAGMPCISDPGELLVRQCLEAGVPVEVVPGPCAIVAALAVSGLSTARFAFEGFLSVKKGPRRKHLRELRGERRTLVFYEAPHKLLSTLEDMREAFGGSRRLALLRELTKLHESGWRGTLDEAVALCRETPPRGEYVLVLEAAPEPEPPEDPFAYALSLARERLAEGAPLSAAAKEAAKAAGVPKSELYAALLKENDD